MFAVAGGIILAVFFFLGLGIAVPIFMVFFNMLFPSAEDKVFNKAWDDYMKATKNK